MAVRPRGGFSKGYSNLNQLSESPWSPHLKAISHQWALNKHLSQEKNCIVCLTDPKRFQLSRYFLSPHVQILHKYCIYAFKYILNIIKQSRPETSEIKSVKENILWGPSPRASLALMTTCRAKAFLEKRYSPSVFDVQSLVKPILSHRLKLNISAKSENVNIEEILDDVISHTKN